MNIEKLRVLAIIPSGFCFGLQHVTIDIFSRFSPAVSSLFLVSKWSNGELEKLLNANKLKFTYSWLGMFSRKMDWYNLKMSLHALSKMPKLYYDFFKTIKTFKPDILFFANHHELILLYPALRITKIPVICHMHDPAPAIPFQQKTFKRYGTVVNRFIAISESVKNRTIKLGCNPDKITTIYNGIEIPKTIRTERADAFCQKMNWEHPVFIAGITGQMTSTKGHLDLLAAFNMAHKKNPLLRLAIGGKPVEPYYSELQLLVNELNLNAVVFFTGWLPDINDFFNNIDLFVLASRHEEGYGLVVAEAMANYLPVIITDSGGAIEIVEDGINGFIVPKMDTSAMAAKLLFLSSNRTDLCKQMGVDARKRMEEHFNIENKVVDMEHFLLNTKMENLVR